MIGGLLQSKSSNSKYIKVLKFEIDSMRDGRGIDLLKCPNIGFMSVSKYILVNSTAIYHHCAANAKAKDQEGIAFICCSLCKQCNLKGRYIYILQAMMTQPVRSSIFVEASKKIYKFFDIHICVCIPHFFLIVHTMWL